MRKTSLILTALLGIAFATAASADSPVRLTAKKVMPNTQIQDTLCNVTEITVLESTLRIKCHDYPGNIFAIHYEYPYYAMSFQGQNRKRMDAVMDVLLYARSQSENFAITFSEVKDDQPVGCAPSNCRELLTVGLVKQ